MLLRPRFLKILKPIAPSLIAVSSSAAAFSFHPGEPAPLKFDIREDPEAILVRTAPDELDVLLQPIAAAAAQIDHDAQVQARPSL